MTRLTPLWSQPGSYPATTDRQLIRAIWPDGGVRGMVPAVVPETMQIQLDPGSVIVSPVDPTVGAWLCVADAPERVQIGTAPPSGQDRIDLVVAAVDDAAPAWAFQVQPGSPASNPVPPAAPAGTTPVCAIRVRGGTAVLAPGDLSDSRRGYQGVPIVTPAELSQPPYNTPFEGQTIDLVADGANGVWWRLRWRAWGSDAFGWRFLGGNALWAFTSSQDSDTGSGVWAAKTPTITVPRPGIYRAEAEAVTWRQSGGAETFFLGVTRSGVASGGESPPILAPGVAGQVNIAANQMAHIRAWGVTGAVPASETLLHTVRLPSAGFTFFNRGLSVWPIRIG